ncbi:MAG: hypothetical protein WC511_02480 [Candidatus Pacearchaeota archaeon]
MAKVGSLINVLNHPVTISYLGEALVLSPRQVVKNVEKEKIGALPKGVSFVAYEK